MIPYSGKERNRFHVLLVDTKMAKIRVIRWRPGFKVIHDVTGVQDGVRLVIADDLGELVLKKVATARVAQQHQPDGTTGLERLERSGFRETRDFPSNTPDSVVVLGVWLEAGELQHMIGCRRFVFDPLAK